VECIYLFGSYAYGVPNEDSDIDLFVVMNDDAPYEIIEAQVMISSNLHGCLSMPTDILVNKNSRFQYRKTGPTLEQEVAEKGIIIYE
jgi:predicted nucleotidyltransferase